MEEKFFDVSTLDIVKLYAKAKNLGPELPYLGFFWTANLKTIIIFQISHSNFSKYQVSCEAKEILDLGPNMLYWCIF